MFRSFSRYEYEVFDRDGVQFSIQDFVQARAYTPNSESYLTQILLWAAAKYPERTPFRGQVTVFPGDQPNTAHFVVEMREGIPVMDFPELNHTVSGADLD